MGSAISEEKVADMVSHAPVLGPRVGAGSAAALQEAKVAPRCMETTR